MTPQWHVKRICAKSQVPYEEFEDDFIVGVGSYAHEGLGYSCVLAVEKGYMLQMHIYFPAGEKPIHDLEMLRSSIQSGLQERLENPIEVGFDPQYSAFYLSLSGIPLVNLEAKISVFIAACDIVYPIFATVKEAGTWDEHVVRLAFQPYVEGWA